MADPLSIAASIAGVVQLSGTVFKLITKFVRDAKDAPSKVRDLAVQTRNLAGILENLKLLASSLDDENSKCALKAQHLNSCRHTLLTIERKLQKAKDDFESEKPLKVISRRLKWPFALSETEELSAELLSHCSTIQLALSADSMDALLKCLSKQGELNKMVERKLNIDMRVQLNQKRKQVIDFFLRVNPQDNFQMSLELRHPMTGLWLTESDPNFQRWKEAGNAKLWLSGIPGGGKTVLCGSVIEIVLQETDSCTAVCYAFCDYKDAKTHQPDNILAALAVQLGQQKKEAFNLLEEYFDELHPQDQLPKQPRREQLLILVKDMASMFDKVYLVIDGLDECGDNIVSMTQSLKSLADCSQTISAAFFSRKEEDIREELEDDYDQIEIEAHTEDLEAYTLAQISQRKSLKKLEVANPSLHEEIFRTLVQCSRGMFRWVACQIDHISDLPTNKARRNALKELPPTLFGTYDRVLDKVRKSAPETQEFVRKALHWVSLGHHWISIPELCEAISIDDELDEIDEDDRIDDIEISRRCGCLLRKSVDGKYFELSHFTVMEYLRGSNSVGEFHYSEIEAFRSLAKTALRFLMFPSFDRKPTTLAKMENARRLERNQAHPFYPFAALLLDREYVPSTLFRTWRLAFGEDPVLFWCKQLFNPTKPGSFMAWCLELATRPFNQTAYQLRLAGRDPAIADEEFGRILGDVLNPATTPLHMVVKLAIPKICEFLLQKDVDVNLISPFGVPLHTVSYYLYRPPCGYDEEDHTEILSMLLDHGADTSIRFRYEPNLYKGSYTGKSVLALTLSGPARRKSIALVRASTAVLEDAIKEFSERLGGRSRPSLSIDFLQAVLKISTGIDVPSQWRPLASPALIMAKRQRLSMPDAPDNVLYDKLSDEDFIEAMRIAITHGLVEDLSALITNTRFLAVIPKREPSIRRLLRLAAESHSTDGGKIMGLLLDSGLPSDVLDSETQNCFYISCKSANAKVAQLLLTRGVDVYGRNLDGETAWHIAASTGNPNLLVSLLNADPDVLRSLSTPSDEGMTPLSLAIRSSHVAASLLLLQHCPADSAFFQSKELLLHLAAKVGFPGLFIALRAKGVDLEAEGPDGSTPLHHLGGSCTHGMVHYLTSLYDPFQLDNNFRSPFERLFEQCLQHHSRLSLTSIGSLDVQRLELLIPPSLTFSRGRDHTDESHVWNIICTVIRGNPICRCESSRPMQRPPPIPSGMPSGMPTPGPPRSYLCDGFCLLVLRTLIDRGSLSSFEKNQKDTPVQPGVISLLTALLKRPKTKSVCSFTISSLIECTIEGSTLSPSLKDIGASYELLQRSILMNDRALTQSLLSFGLDVHRGGSVPGGLPLSPLEAACSEANFSTLEPVLAAADLSRLNNPKPSDLNLIDLVLSGSSTDRIPMAQALFDKGVRLKAGSESQATVDAAKNENWDVVKWLVTLGGNPFFQDEKGWATVHFVVREQTVDMIKWLEVSTSAKPSWEATCRTVSRVTESVDEGVSLLHLAATNGKDDMITYFLDQGFLKNINISTKSGETPLHSAAENGHLSTCELLISRGAKLDMPTKNGSFPINFALRGGHMGVAECLLKAGSPSMAEWADEAIMSLTVDQEALCRSAESTTISKRMRDIWFEKAILDGDLAACQNAISHGCSLHQPLPSCHNCTPLFAAIRAGKEDVIEWLLTKGAGLAGVSCYHNTYCDLPQHVVESFISTECMSKVLSASLQQGIFWYPGSISPIYIAVEEDDEVNLEAILTHIQSNISDYRTLLEPHLMTESRLMSDREVLSLLVNQPNKLEDDDTALHNAVYQGNLSAVELLIDHGANVNAQSEDQPTPLIIASRSDDVEITQKLLDSGAVVNSTNGQGYTAMAEAVKMGNLDIVKLLAAESSSTLDYISPAGENLVSLSAQAESPLETFQYLISLGVSVLHKDLFGNCGLHKAMWDPDLFDYIIKSGLSSQMPTGPVNPFTVAINYAVSLKQVFKCLPPEISKGFIDLGTPGCLSPLCETAYRNLPQAAAQLLDFQADIEHEGSPLGTPLMVAAAFGKLDVVKLLVRRGAKLEYVDKNETYRSAFISSLLHTEVTAWLLVGRFQDQQKLADCPFWENATVKTWSGTRAAQVELKPYEQLRWGESMLDYCKWILQIRKSLVGQRVIGKLV
ncbi:hypothetical protein BKA56DRAFT_583810 [Ilyonectria sp. MPI-CAGE-AT-0026]|nr:hypothetical protein BKA56DRAFT_583810 [Ilyonectria sp. MPI-CAGE-AT-0026]